MRSPRPAPPQASALEHAASLAPDLLLLVARLGSSARTAVRASLHLGDRPYSLETRAMTCAGSGARLIVLELPSSAPDRCSFRSLVLEAGKASLALDPAALSRASTDLRTLVRDSLAGLDAEARAEVMEFLAAAAGGPRDAEDGLGLSKSLHLIREAIRERLPCSAIERGRPQAVHVESLLAIDERAFYVKGWMRSEDARVCSLAAVSPEGSRVELLEGLFRHARKDIDDFYGTEPDSPRASKCGFLGYFETGAPSRLPDGWLVEMRTAEGPAFEAAAPAITRDAAAVRRAVLADLTPRRSGGEDLIVHHVFPAMMRLQQRTHRRAEIESVDCYGRPNESAAVSIVVPLYQRLDFLEQQLAHFAHDPEIRDADLLYVLDSPEQADELRRSSEQLFRLYRVPFRVLTLTCNAGFSAANNLGASRAYGRLLLLLNSDVIPDRPGWLGTMTAFHDSTPGIGALGAKLLYEDDSLQHAGLYFSRPECARHWENMHYFKGLHRSLPAANVARSVPAVTAACMMISAGLYSRLGGLRAIYAQADYEDSDLCLRLLEAGLENWYLPSAELYHLEGQSYPSELRRLAREYNLWLHTRLWNEQIEAVMGRFASPVAESAAAAARARRAGEDGARP